MIRLFVGIVLFILGLLVSVVAYYYAWVAGTPDLASNMINQFQKYSMLFGAFSIGIVLGGIWLTITAVRRMNKEYHEHEEANS